MSVNAIFAQSVNPTVITSSGDYMAGPDVSLSWTLGELATETFSNGCSILNQGFQQPILGISISGINLELFVFLEGSYTSSQMSTSLNDSGMIPLSQPYNNSPWNYSGTEAVSEIPNENVVDWVLVELRDAPDASSATSATRLARQSAFLLHDGSVVGTDGSSVLQFNNSFTHQLFVVVWHRNHLGIMSANGINGIGGIYSYKFSLSESQVYGGEEGYKALGEGVWGMVAGDGTHDGIIDLSDKLQWNNLAGTKGYLDSDFSMDAQVNNHDKNEGWQPNSSKTQQIPE